jgi:predicted porin
MTRIPSCLRVLAGAAALATIASANAADSVVIYGIFDAVVRNVDNAAPSGGSLTSMEDGIFTGSRLGFRGREELGNGLAAVFTMESGFDPGTGTSLQASPAADYGQTAVASRFWGRQIFVGLRGDGWGLNLGRQYTLAHSMTANFQPEGNPNNNALSIFSSHHVARQDNVLRVDGKVGGVELSAAHTFGEVTGNDGSDTSAVGASYSGGALWLAAYAQIMSNVTDTETRKIFGLGGNYKVTPALALYAGAMRRTNEVSPQVNKVWTLGINWEALPKIGFSAAWLDDRQSGDAALDGSRTVGYVTATYHFSRRTDVYAVLDRNEVEGGYAKPAFMGTLGSQKGVSLALRHRF